MFQHHVTFRNLSEGKGTVRLNSGKLNLLTHLKISWVENCRIIFSQENMRRVDLKCFSQESMNHLYIRFYKSHLIIFTFTFLISRFIFHVHFLDIQVYIPCILFVTVSWISFVIDPKVRIMCSTIYFCLVHWASSETHIFKSALL